MKIIAEIGGRRFAVNLQRAQDIAIAVRFDDVQLSVFGVGPARHQVVRAGDYVGSVAQGGSCNCETYTITPHCNGTHTECVGHITGERLAVTDMLRDSLLPATLVTVRPVLSGENYVPAPQSGDVMITRESLQRALADADDAFLAALVVRTLPNGADKVARDYNQAMPAYFSHDAMAYIVERGVRHLLVDTPSVDRLADEGRLGNHRLFWDSARSPKTITELVYAPDDVRDGRYVLNLQVAPFRADAAPSRPLLYEVSDDF